MPSNSSYFCPMQRYFMHIGFSGRNYHGWQRQPNGITVQEVIEKALWVLLKEKLTSTGCGRTDAGVHARNFYLHFNLQYPMPEEVFQNLVYRLNQILPPDIAVYSVFPVAEDMHARFSALSRTYSYYISREKNPFLSEISWRLTLPLEVSKMQEGASMLIGTADFSCFSKSHTQTRTNICTISQAEWEEKGGLLVFTITADRFLRNMVRAIVGTLMDLGKENITFQEFEGILKSGNRSEAGDSVPAHGLFLERIDYPPF